MLNDTEKEKVTQTQEKEKMDGRRESIHLAKIGVMVFIISMFLLTIKK